LLETVHGVTLVKLGTPPEAGQANEEREAQEGWATALSFAALHRLWQLLLKGHDEVARAALPIEACEMALLRVVHASQMPDPGDLARQLAAGGPVQIAAPAGAPAAPAPAPMASGEPALPGTIEEIIAAIEKSGEFGLAVKLERSASVIRIAPPELVLSAARPLPADMVRDLTVELKNCTGRAWKVTTEDAPGAPTIKERRGEAREGIRAAILASPVVKAAFEAFPDAVLPEDELDRLVAAQKI
jgi:DNA polymerase-3 subunit gamma/tau